MAFITVTDVPIFDEHGDYAESDLVEIAANSQARIDDTGDECPLTLGHTPKRGENKPQPPIVGFANNFRVDQFGKSNPRPCIFADFKIEAKHADLVREQYPRRSIELWPQDRVIDPISLLGATTPQRDLGLLKFERKSDGKERYSRERDGEPIRHQFNDDHPRDDDGEFTAKNSIRPKSTLTQRKIPKREFTVRKKNGKSVRYPAGKEIPEKEWASFDEDTRRFISNQFFGDEQGSEEDKPEKSSKRGEPIQHEMRDEAMFGMPEFMSMFLETPIGKWIQNQMEKEMQADGVADINAEQVNKNAEELNAADDGLDLEGDGDLDALGGDENTFDDEIEPGEGFEDEPIDDVSVDDESPDPKKKKEPVKMAKQDDKVRMERDSLAIKFAKLEERLKVTEGKLAVAEEKALKADRERQFTQLESEGIAFERAEEMAYCEGMSAEQFAKHCDHMKKRYSRSVPGNGRPLFSNPISDGGGEPRKKVIASDVELEEVHKYARDNKVNFNEALKVFTK